MRNKILFHSFFMVILFWSVQLSGQDLTQKKIDSLFSLANSIKGKAGDSLKIVANNLIAFSKKEGNELGLVKGRLMASLYYINKMKLDSAKQLLNECEGYVNSDDKEVHTTERALYNYLTAEIAMRRSQFAEAERYAVEALHNYEKDKNEKGMAATYLQLGNIYYLLENYSKALDYYLQALNHKINAGGGTATYAYELKRIADIYQQMGQYDKALAYLRRCYFPSNINNAHLFQLIGNIHQLKGNLDSAMYYYEKAKDLISPTSDKANQSILNLDIARLHTLRGKFDESNTVLLRLLGQNEPNHLMSNSRIWSQLSYNYLKLNKIDSALFYSKKAYQIVKGRGMKLETINSTYVLSEVFKTRGKFDSAYYYSDIYHHNKDSLFNIENQRKLSTLYAEIETIAKQREIEGLEKQKEIDAIQNRNLMLIILLGAIAFTSILISLFLYYRNSQKKQALNNLLLQQELDKRNKDLHEQALKMIYMNNSFMEIEESLKRLHFQSPDSAKDIRQLLSNLQLNKTLEKEWDNFNRYFGTVHGNFFNKINAEFPELTTSEKRLASLIKMNLTNREIASILNIESTSVKIAKYRLKKKLNLDEETDIHSFFQNLE
ncbi:MAG: hypothetical protein EBR30_10825 [Cytophagia bacterium]|nr:hypothetical protein [Cytophagia bacterium]